MELALAADKGVGRFRKLAPICDEEGIWRVGSRIKNFVPFTVDNKMPIIIPPEHRITMLVMRDAHQFSHAGQDGTLTRFWSNGFWTLRAGHLAKSISSKCVPCRKISNKTSSQTMGGIPPEFKIKFRIRLHGDIVKWIFSAHSNVEVESILALRKRLGVWW